LKFFHAFEIHCLYPPKKLFVLSAKTLFRSTARCHEKGQGQCISALDDLNLLYFGGFSLSLKFTVIASPILTTAFLMPRNQRHTIEQAPSG